MLAHQSPGTLCQWWPYAAGVSDLGYRVIAIDFEGYGASTSGDLDYAGDVVAAAQWLRTQQAGDIVLMGASMGGTAVVTAAARLSPPPAGVVDLSGPPRFSGMDAIAAATRVRAPILFGVGLRDGGFTAGIDETRAAAGETTTSLVTVPSNSHGAALVDPVVGYQEVRDAVAGFLRRIAPP